MIRLLWIQIYKLREYMSPEHSYPKLSNLFVPKSPKRYLSYFWEYERSQNGMIRVECIFLLYFRLWKLLLLPGSNLTKKDGRNITDGLASALISCLPYVYVARLTQWTLGEDTMMVNQDTYPRSHRVLDVVYSRTQMLYELRKIWTAMKDTVSDYYHGQSTISL